MNRKLRNFYKKPGAGTSSSVAAATSTITTTTPNSSTTTGSGSGESTSLGVASTPPPPGFRTAPFSDFQEQYRQEQGGQPSPLTEVNSQRKRARTDATPGTTTGAHTPDGSQGAASGGEGESGGSSAGPAVKRRLTGEVPGAKSAPPSTSTSTSTSTTSVASVGTTSSGKSGKNSGGRSKKRGNQRPRGRALPSESGAGNAPNFSVTHPQVTFADVGGMGEQVRQIRETLECPLRYPQVLSELGVDPPKGVLVHGPPGCGKTLLAKAIAGHLGVPLIAVNAPEIVSGLSGESERSLRTIFQRARDEAPCLVFLDEIDAIARKRGTTQRSMDHRIVSQLQACMDACVTGYREFCAARRLPAQITPGSREGGASSTQHGPATVNSATTTTTTTTTATMDTDQTASSRASSVTAQTQVPIVVVIAATNRPDALDAAFRSRFDREISIPVPSQRARAAILSVLCKGMKVARNVDFRHITRHTAGFVGADLGALCREAATVAIRRIFHRYLERQGAPVMLEDTVSAGSQGTQSASGASGGVSGGGSDGDVSEVKNAEDGTAAMETSPAPTSPPPATTTATTTTTTITLAQQSAGQTHPPMVLTGEMLRRLCITQEDFMAALPNVQPSSRREGFATLPDVTWDQIGALAHVRRQLQLSITLPIRNPEQFERIGLSVPTGILLFGPPGCGKTLVAKALANESGASFLSIKGPELLNPFVGSSEKAVRTVFSRARASSPCVIFFDELDALCPRRGQSPEGSHVSERVVNQLLTEMDGLNARGRVYVVAATNRPEIIDPAMLRPGRLDKMLYIRLPDAAGREAILRKHAVKCPLAPDCDLRAVATRCANYSGADCAALVREATLQALQDAQASCPAFALQGGWAGPEGKDSSGSSGSTDGGERKEGVRDGPDGEPLVLKVVVRQLHFDRALKVVRCSVSERSRRLYDRMYDRLCKARSVLDSTAEEASGPVKASEKQ